jgi:hypothetical protein
MIEAPYSELDESSDILDEFHGFTDEEDNGDGFNEAIRGGRNLDNSDFQDFDPTADPMMGDDMMPLRNRNGDLLVDPIAEDLSHERIDMSQGNDIHPQEEEFKYNHDYLMKRNS